MKPNHRQNFKSGGYIADIIDQIPNNIILFDGGDKERISDSNYVGDTNICSNVTGIFDCSFDIKNSGNKRPHSVFLAQILGDSMLEAGINDGDIILVDSSVQAVNNSIVLAEINNCICVKRIKFLNNNFILFSENPKYSPVTVKKSDNFVVWGVVLSTLDKM